MPGDNPWNLYQISNEIVISFILTNGCIGLEPCLLPTLPPCLRGSIPSTPDPNTPSFQFSRNLPWQHPLSFRRHLLHIYHIARLQCSSILAPHRAPSPTYCCLCNPMDCQPSCWLGHCWRWWDRSGVVLGYQITLRRIRLSFCKLS
jgi:hypothetical protein